MLLLLKPDNGWSAISPENRDPLFRIALKTLKFEGAQAPKKEARPKDRAHLTRCGAIYSEIAKKQWVVERIPSAGEGLFGRSYRNWAGFARYCRRADKLELVRV
jgi:hypothetical protein